jgi:HK97 family phage portal protein
MGLLERVQVALAAKQERTWPVGPGAVPLGDRFHGHQSEFSPESYGDYIATSNEIYSAANLRARLMSGLDLGVFAGRGSEKTEITRGPVVDLLRKVNPYWTLRRLLRMDELSMCLWGESYWAIEKRNGVPAEIWWLKPSRVRPVPHETGYIAEFLYEPVTGGPPIPFAPDEVVWFRYPNPVDEFAALSPLAAARLAADTGQAMMTSNRNLFRDGLQMGGLIVPTTDKVTFSAEQAAELEHLLDRRWKGVDKAHKWAVLRYEAQLKTLGVTPKDAEFANGLNLTLRQVGNAYGIPTPLLNDMEHATLSNAREYQQILWAHALVPDADFKAAEIEEQLLPMFGRTPGRRAADHVEWDYSKVPALQEAASEIWDRERGQMEVGAITINEWRKTHGLPPVEWGDVWWGPVNKSAVTDAESTPQGDTTPPAVPDGSADPEPPAEPADQAQIDDTARALLLSALNGHGRA